MDLDGVDRHLKAALPEAYAGLCRLDAGGVAIYRTDGHAIDLAANRLLPDTALHLELAEHSYRDLRQIADRVDSDLDFWRSREVRIVSIAVPYDGSRVVLMTPTADRDRAAIVRRYGASYVTVIAGDATFI